MHKDRFGNPIGIRKNNVVIIHDKTFKGLSMRDVGATRGQIGLVVEYGCVGVHTGPNNGGVFNETDLEVIGTL